MENANCYEPLLIKLCLCLWCSYSLFHVVGGKLDLAELLEFKIKTRTNTVLLSSLNSIKSRCHLLKTSERQGMARLQFACSYTCYSWHESELPVITEYALAVPFWYFCVGGVRRNRELALCCNHSFRKGFSRWSCFLWTKHLGPSELSKGGNC